MKIHAAVTRAPRTHMSFETLELDAPRDDEVLVRVVATGICHTDLAMRDQVFPVPQPIVLGHEGAGRVEAVGKAVRKVRRGDPVVMTYDSCGRCPSCLLAQSSYCHEIFAFNFAGRRADGTSSLRSGQELVHSHFFGQSSFATYSICRERNVIPVPSDAPLKLLGPLACGVQTGAGTIINSLAVAAGSSVAIWGAGSVGLSAIMAAHLVGATTIIAIDRNSERLTLASELGATHTVDTTNDDLDSVIASASPGGTNFAVDTTGSPGLIESAIRHLAPRGVCALVAATESSVNINLNIAHLMTAGRSVRGIVEGDAASELFIPALVKLHLQGRFPFDRLIRFYRFSELNDAIEATETGKTIKPVVEMP